MPEASPVVKVSRRGAWFGAVIVGVAAVSVFGWDLSAEPAFVDEWAYVSQTYFAELLTQPDHPAWLEYPALDLPPLPKYVMGGALKLAGYQPPPRERWPDWYRETHTTYGPPAMLTAARRPSVVFGAIGCMAIYAIGTLAIDRRAGLFAAGLLMLDPLYRMLARRAMSDIYSEALILATAAAGLWGWRTFLAGRSGPRTGFTAYLGAGVLAGLAVLSKFNGVLGLAYVGAWTVLAFALRGLRWDRRLMVALGSKLCLVLAIGTFTLLNPFLTAHPGKGLPAPLAALSEKALWDRAYALVEHRLTVPREQQATFPHNALTTLEAKVKAVIVQGFGRFGPLGQKRHDAEHPRGWFDSTRRYDWRQDAGAVIWLPWVICGMFWWGWEGQRQNRANEPPTAWAVLIQACVGLIVVTALLPLAWDRYFISIQPGSCLMAAGLVSGVVDVLRRRVLRTRVAL